MAKFISLICSILSLCGCADLQRYASSVDYNATGSYNDRTGASRVTFGGTIHFRDPTRLPNYSKDK